MLFLLKAKLALTQQNWSLEKDLCFYNSTEDLTVCYLTQIFVNVYLLLYEPYSTFQENIHFDTPHWMFDDAYFGFLKHLRLETNIGRFEELNFLHQSKYCPRRVLVILVSLSRGFRVLLNSPKCQLCGS